MFRTTKTAYPSDPRDNAQSFILLFYATTCMYAYFDPLRIIIPVRTIFGFQ